MVKKKEVIDCILLRAKELLNEFKNNGSQYNEIKVHDRFATDEFLLAKKNALVDIDLNENVTVKFYNYKNRTDCELDEDKLITLLSFSGINKKGEERRDYMSEIKNNLFYNIDLLFQNRRMKRDKIVDDAELRSVIDEDE